MIHSIGKDASDYILRCVFWLRIFDKLSPLWYNPQSFLLWEVNDNISNSKNKQHGAYVSPTIQLLSLTLRGHRKWHLNSACANSQLPRVESTANRPIYEVQRKNIKTAIGLWKIVCYLWLLIMGFVPFVLIPEMCYRSRTLY